MTEYTTIQITKAQAQALQERKQYDDESYKSVIARLLEGDNSAIDTNKVAREVVSQLDYAELANAVASEVENRMRR